MGCPDFFPLKNFPSSSHAVVLGLSSSTISFAWGNQGPFRQGSDISTKGTRMHLLESQAVNMELSLVMFPHLIEEALDIIELTH